MQFLTLTLVQKTNQRVCDPLISAGEVCDGSTHFRILFFSANALLGTIQPRITATILDPAGRMGAALKSCIEAR